MATLKEYRRAFKGLKWHQKIYWYFKLKRMDNNPYCFDKCFRILPPSYYYLHTPEECETEQQRIIVEAQELLAEYRKMYNLQG